MLAEYRNPVLMKRGSQRGQIVSQQQTACVVGGCKDKSVARCPEVPIEQLIWKLEEFK
jgi:hypothetical protein